MQNIHLDRQELGLPTTAAKKRPAAAQRASPTQKQVKTADLGHAKAELQTADLGHSKAELQGGSQAHHGDIADTLMDEDPSTSGDEVASSQENASEEQQQAENEVQDAAPASETAAIPDSADAGSEHEKGSGADLELGELPPQPGSVARAVCS